MLILVSTLTGCVSISAFASLACVPVGIMSSAVGITSSVNYKENEEEVW